ncbi:MAG TPA: sigma-70 family RNA polymerase sigma factor [Thermoanaerobaculia bacterium]|jgi:RNA polymerase sigma factor (sigma-70 family)|nr:sigma-70 family RNA polymerase sigma factor [Thermoanaerobaculia bacterium]
MVIEQDLQISEVVTREQPRLRDFIRRRVPDAADVDDVLQDVFSRLIEANRLLMPIDHVTGWLFTVARNRITDLFRKSRDEEEDLELDELLASDDTEPDALFAQRALVDELEAAIAELSAEQRAVFVAHELEGRSFKSIAEETGVGSNTLLSRKRYAVLRLRERLKEIHEELT